MIRVAIYAPPGSAYVREAVDSCAGQSLPPDEILVIEDGRPAHEASEVETVRGEIPVQVVRHDPLLGRAACLNAAFSSPGADFVLPLDADQQLAPGFLRKSLDLLDQHPRAGFAYCWVRVADRDARVWRCARWQLGNLWKQSLCDSAVLLRRPAWEQAGGYDQALSGGNEDWDLQLDLAEQDTYGVVVPEPLIATRWSGTGREPGSLLSWRSRRTARTLLRRHRRLFESNAGMPECRLRFPLLEHGIRKAFRAVRGGGSETEPAETAPAAPRQRAKVKTAASPKILMATDAFRHGGLEVVVLEEARAFRSRGIDARIAARTTHWHPPGETVMPLTPDLVQQFQPSVVISNAFGAHNAMVEPFDVPLVKVMHNYFAWIEPHEIDAMREELTACE